MPTSNTHTKADIPFFARILSELDYPDPVRVANEIISHTNKTDADVQDILKRLKNNEPWDYIRGYSEFYERKFIVNPSVLIPRLETEKLVDIALSRVEDKRKKDHKVEVIDVGTGSGCVLITLADIIRRSGSDSAEITYTGMDISSNAIKVARKNAANLLTKDTHLQFLRSDLLEQYVVDDPNAVKIITANLPYITPAEMKDLDPSVIDWEPHIALLDQGNDGLALTKELLLQVIRLFDRFIIIFELDPKQIKPMKHHLEELSRENDSLRYRFHTDQFEKVRFFEVDGT